MKKLTYILIGLGLAVFATAQAAQPALTVFQGGTGSTTPSGILIGDNGATPRLSTLTIGSNLTLTGTTLSASGGGSTYPFTPGTFGLTPTSATTTALSGSFVSISSSTLEFLTILLSTTTNATTSELALVGSAKACNGTSALTTSAVGNITCSAQPQGTVTAVSVASANGFAGTSGGGATPALTLTTTITGLLKGNGTAISAAALTDFPSQGANTVIANGTGASAVPTAFATSSLFQNASATLSGLLTSTDWTTFNNKVATTRALTVAGTAQQITSSAGAQDLSADRTWTLTLPAHVKFPGNFEATNSTTTNATTTGSQYFSGITASRPLYVDSTGKLTSAGSGVSGNCVQWAANNTLGDAGSACGTGGAGTFPFTPSAFFNSTSTLIQFSAGIFASSTSLFGPATTTFQGDVKISTTSATALSVRTNAGLVNFNLDNTSGLTKWGIGTTTPSATLSVHLNNLDPNPFAFLIASSTATATTSLFSVSNIGSTTLASTFGTCSSPNALTTNSSGTIVCAAISASTFAYPFTPTNSFNVVASATSTVMLLTAGLNASTTVRFGNAAVASQFLWDGANGWLGLASTTPAFIFSVNNAGSDFYIDSTGKVVARDTTNAWSGRLSPTRAFVLETATTTTWGGTTTSPYVPFLTMPFTGTLRDMRCTATSTQAFLGIAPRINAVLTTPSYTVASTTVGQTKFTANNTFTVGDRVSIYVGTTTTDANALGVSCTFTATET